MTDYMGTKLTKKGRALQAKAQTGVKLEFTKVMIGDGLVTAGIDLDTRNQLIAPKMTLNIQEMAVIGDGTTRLRVAIHNADVNAGFFVREVGLFAKDPNEGEILYSITNSGDKSEWLPAKGEQRVVEIILDLITIIGNAANVTAVIDDSLVFATKQNLKDHVNDKNNPHAVTALQVGAAPAVHTHTVAQITNFPTSLPANGGNATTVGGVRVTIGTGAPPNPGVDKELWIDTGNNITRVYTTGGWRSVGAVYL